MYTQNKMAAISIPKMASYGILKIDVFSNHFVTDNVTVSFYMFPDRECYISKKALFKKSKMAVKIYHKINMYVCIIYYYVW